MIKKTTLFFFLSMLMFGRLSAEEKPNIVLLYIDDWAWCGSSVRMNDKVKNSKMPLVTMPNIEKLASDGMKFSNAYGSPQCSPARVCVQTGQCSPHNGFTVYMNPRAGEYYDETSQYKYMPMVPNVSDSKIDADAETIPEVLKKQGYTSAHIGKWHMRGSPEDEGYVLHDGNTDNKPGNTLKNAARIPDDITDPKLMFSVTNKAVKFIEKQAKAGKPFYCQISHYGMHEGRECLPKTREKYINHPLVQQYYKEHDYTAESVNRKNDPAVWLGMAEDVDGRIGVVIEKLKELGVYENTYIVVVADNGYRHDLVPGFKQPLHSRKWWCWEGGIRVPMIVKGPGIKQGSKFSANVVNYDLLPTFYSWAGGDPKDLKDVDGVSLKGYLEGEKPSKEFINRNLYFHYPHYRTTVPHSAMVTGNHKVMHFYDTPVPVLFDLSKDQGEVKNIAKKKADLHKKLYDEMMGYLKDVGARLPKDNPNYNKEEYEKAKFSDERLMWGPFEGERELEEDEI